MTHSPHLTQRQAQVLQATVRHYIATAEPVGSKVLVNEYDFSVSPATIRNTMGVLEKAGFLYQPHISAGRIPSDSGYRIYVDQLLTPSSLLAEQISQILAGQLKWEDWSLEAVLRRSAQVLSSLSGYIALITLPQAYHVQLRYLKLVQIEPGQVLLVLVLSNYETRSALFHLPDWDAENNPDLCQEEIEHELQVLSNFLNYHLQGKLLSELDGLAWKELEQQLQRYGDRIQQLLSALSRRDQNPAPSQILVSGIAEVLRQPEFTELEQVKALLQLLEDEQDQLWPIIFEMSDISDSNCHLKVCIGSENPLQPMRSCSLISALYRQKGVAVGSVGVLGPTRMVYENAIAAVEATAHYLSDVFK
jgi:heat-inducible transcriptional repressor